MNQKTINAELIDENDVDYLIFHIDDTNYYKINLNSSDSQNEMKNLFSELLGILVNEEISIIFSHPEEYARHMYIDICKEYIDDLNREITSVSRKIRSELHIG